MKRILLMKCARILLIIVLIGTQACRQSETPQTNVEPPPQSEGVPSTSCEKAIGTQNRINRYFHNAVLPKLESCWQQVKGQGSIAIEFNYKRSGSNWATETMSIQRSTLPEGQDAIALKCLQNSVEGTSFRVEEDDGSAEEFFVNWSWPVPLPKDINAVAQRMISSSSGTGQAGECGGSEGPPPECKDCFTFFFIRRITWCGDACVGYKKCTETQSGCNMSQKCATGSLFGNSGGLAIY